jgi:hypothetical protein
MTNDEETGNGRRRNRFIIHPGEIEVTGRREPEPEERDRADRLFSRILKNRKQRGDE